SFKADTTIELAGRAVFPGFIDAHAHLEGLGVFLNNIDLMGTGSVREIQGLVRERAETIPAGVWIRGRGWDQNDWEMKVFPDHSALDQAAGGIPVYLDRVDGHAVWVNRKVLEIAGITRDTPDPEGGAIIRDEHGEPTGIFVDNAVDMLDSVLPEPTTSERRESILRAVHSCLRVGLTTVHSMGVDLEEIGIYKDLIQTGQFPFRVYAAIDGTGPTWDHYAATGPEVSGFDGRLTVRTLKLYADGALGSYGAALIEPYTDAPDRRGFTVTSDDSMRILGEQAIRNGFQLSVHAIGDRANHITLNIYRDLFERMGRGGSGLRFRIEHVQVLDPPDILRFARMGVLPVMQPTHCTSDMYWVETRLGPERTRSTYTWRSLINSGSILPAGSDFPVESNNPLWGFYAAITRQDHQGWPEGGWFPEERMTREEALRAFTIWAAYAGFEEELKGSISKGKYADIVVLSKDIMTVPADEILKTEVAMTIVGGEIVHTSGLMAGRGGP
ncbi:MAG: amidohydrolase, partial [Ignavibacteria bacterium]|nr:amidohydrolase [Ignavibacteria bacterium]